MYQFNNNLTKLQFVPRITKKKTGGTFFLIDEYTGAQFSQSDSGIFTFQNEEDSKWLYTDNPININTDIHHFTTFLENGVTCIEGMFSVFENKEAILQEAFNYFSKFILEEKEETDKQKWNIFLN